MMVVVIFIIIILEEIFNVLIHLCPLKNKFHLIRIFYSSNTSFIKF